MRAAARLTLAGIALFALTFSLHAATYTLANPAGGDWDNVSIWLADGSPATVAPGTNAGDSVELTGSGAQVRVDAAVQNAVALTMSCTSCTVNVFTNVLRLTDSSIGSGAQLQTSHGTIELASGSTLQNSGTLLFQEATSGLTCSGGTACVVDNDGLLRKTTISETELEARIFSDGQIEVVSGVLKVDHAPNTVTGAVNVGQFALLIIGPTTFTASSSVSGEGRVWLTESDSAHHTIAGSWTVRETLIRAETHLETDLVVRNLEIVLNAPIFGDGDVTVTNRFDWDGAFGGQDGGYTGTVTIGPAATGSAQNAVMFSGLLRNEGSFGGSLGLRTTFENIGTFRLVRIRSFQEAFVDNQGTMIVGDNDSGEIQATLRNSGLIDVQGGTLVLNVGHSSHEFTQVAGGEIRLIDTGPNLNRPVNLLIDSFEQMFETKPLQLLGGLLTGSGGIKGAVVNSGGTVSPGGTSIGQFRFVDGTYTQDASGTLDIDLAGTMAKTEYDQLVLTTSTAPESSISGTLDVDLIDGFVPEDGDFFDVIAFQQLNGDFTTKNLPSKPNLTFTTQKLANAYRLLVQVDSPDLTVESSASPAATAIDENVDFRIVVTNDGTSTASAVSLANVLSGGTVVNIETSQGTCSGTSMVNCSLGTLAPGASAIVHIIITSSVAQTVTVVSIASANSETETGNNSDLATAEFRSGIDLAITKTGPPFTRVGNTVTYTIRVTNNGPSTATNVVVSDPTPAQLTFVDTSGACATPFPCNLGTLDDGATRVITARYTVTSDGTRITNVATVSSSSDDPAPSNNSATERTTLLRDCTTAGPELLEPANGSTVQSPVTFRWTAVAGATRYVVFAGTEGEPAQIGESTTTSFTAVLPDGAVTWYVIAEVPECGGVASEGRGQFRVCAASLPAPVLEGPAVVSKNIQMGLKWSAVPGAVAYQLDQATDPNFVDSFTHTVTFTTWVRSGFDTVGDYFYRVRAVSACGTESPYSATHRVVVVPQSGNELVVNVAGGSSAELSVHVDGFEGSTLPFEATTDAEWLTVAPATGDLPADGRDLAVRVGGLIFNGTHVATLIVTTSAGERRIPVTVHVVSSVRPVAATAPTAESLVIPVVGHLRGQNSHWQSDVRIANLENNIVHRYALTLISGTARETVILVGPGTTVALDDIAKNWFGVGALNDDGSGMLQIRPLDGALRPLVTSRTYNVTGYGTLGQSVPALASEAFIGNDGSILTLQQLVQFSAFRTNLGVVEGFGAPASVEVSIFDANGTKLHDATIALQPFQQLQLNGFLAAYGIQSDNARIEVRVTSGSGRVAAYASVIDNTTNDPLLVSAVRLGTPRANRYVFAGAADIMNSAVNWRTDLRLFNSTAAPQPATLTFHPFGGAATVRETTVQPGQVLTFDSVLRSYFGVQDTGGTVHITTANESNLVLTGRTYDQREQGTYGQFIDAFLPSDAASVANGRTLQLVHVEDSPRYRSNLGIAETSGETATVQVQILASNGNPLTTFNRTLQPYALLQFRAIRDLGLGDVYNARLTVRVTGGDGSVVAYVSVVDNQTQDPTYVSAQ
jgi:uncharacterized repeat protein (TIGR01451 family)